MPPVIALPARHQDEPNDTTLRIARRTDRCSVLGPGERSVIWVQGCALRCHGCLVPESHARDAGELTPVDGLAEALLRVEGVDGLTATGGEPFLQAAALVRLVDALRAARPDYSLMAYSGYRLETLQRRGSDAQRALLARLDLLIDGPFVAARQDGRLWRGSANQRIHVLSDRHAAELEGRPDRSDGIEVELVADGRLAWNGVPGSGFRDELDAACARRAVRLVRHIRAAGGGEAA